MHPSRKPIFQRFHISSIIVINGQWVDAILACRFQKAEYGGDSIRGLGKAGSKVIRAT